MYLLQDLVFPGDLVEVDFACVLLGVMVIDALVGDLAWRCERILALVLSGLFCKNKMIKLKQTKLYKMINRIQKWFIKTVCNWFEWAYFSSGLHRTLWRVLAHTLGSIGEESRQIVGSGKLTNNGGVARIESVRTNWNWARLNNKIIYLMKLQKCFSSLKWNVCLYPCAATDMACWL